MGIGNIVICRPAGGLNSYSIILLISLRARNMAFSHLDEFQCGSAFVLFITLLLGKWSGVWDF